MLAHSYTASSIHHYLLMVFILLFISSCVQSPIEKCNESESIYAFAEFPVGVAVDLPKLEYHTRYRDIVQTQFNSITPENAFKAAYLHPSPGSFNFSDANRLVAFATQHGKRLHGHTIIWHNQLPGWIETFQGNKEQWEQLFKEYIQNICSYFKGKVTAWDVVNEAFNNDGTLRNTIWKEKIGTAYIEKAFLYAHESDPNALLFYNDYDLAMNERKRTAVIDYLSKIKAQGVPVHGIGMQTHISISHPANDQVRKCMEDIFMAGFKVHVSELDISVNPVNMDIELSDELLRRQAERLAQVIAAYKSIPPEYQYGITMWGVSDLDSWIPPYFQREDYPLLYDTLYQPKPAYCTFKETL